MKFTLSILQVLNRFYWFKRLYYFKLINYFNQYHLKPIIIKANKSYRVSEYLDLVFVMNQSSFKGLISGYFYPNEFYPTPLDIAVSINISVNAYCNESYVNYDAIIDSAYHISQEIKERIIYDDFLQDLMKMSNKKLDKIIVDFPRSMIEDAFREKKLLFKNYFKTYGNENYSTSIRIWHQGYNTTWIEWKKEDSLDLKMDLNKIREGFFIGGFDYSINNTERLQFAYRKNGFEYYNQKIENGKLIWAN